MNPGTFLEESLSRVLSDVQDPHTLSGRYSDTMGPG